MKQIGAAMRYISHSCSILSLGNVFEVFNAKVGVSTRWLFGPKSARGDQYRDDHREEAPRFIPYLSEKG